jgi:hypothetical protein
MLMLKKKKIFQIGFNRCATQSLSEAFKRIGLRVFHHSNRLGLLADIMHENCRLGRPAIFGLDAYECFSDMENASEGIFFYEKFAMLESQNKDSIFIMNLRPVGDWVESRCRLGDANGDPTYRNPKIETMIEWVNHYFRHCLAVRKHFEASNQTRLFLYPIHKMSVDKLMGDIGLTSSIKVDNIKLDAFEGVSNLKAPLDYIQLKLGEVGDPCEKDWWGGSVAT